MATSGSKSVAVTSYDTLKISWTCDSQSTANNTSTCTFKAQLISTSSGRISSTASKAYTATVNGTEYTGTNTVGIAASSTLTLWSKTITIAHDSDGSKSFTFSFDQTFAITFSGTYIGSVSASCTVELPDIARASSITSASAVTLGNAVSVKWTPASSSFAYKLKFTVGSYSATTGYISPGSTSAYTYTGYTMAIATWAPYITTSTAATCTVTLYTYSSSSSSTAIGSATGSFTVTVPSSVVPSVSFTVAEAASVSLGVYVQGKSKVKVTSTGTTAYGAAIKSYAVKVGSASYSGSSVTSGTLSTSGSVTISVTVTDARGRTGSASQTITVYAYASPKISAFTAVRCTSDGTEDTDGEYVKITYAYSVSSCNSTNTASMTIKWKLSSASSYSTTLTSGTSLTVTTTTLIPTTSFSNESSYDFQISVTDAFTTATKTAQVSTSIYSLSFHSSGLGAAFGKSSENTDLLDIAWNERVRGNLTVDGTATLNGNLLADTAIFAGTLTTEGYLYTPRVEIGDDSATDTSRCRVTNAYADGGFLVNASGDLGIYDYTNAGWLLRKTSAGVVTLDGYAAPKILTGSVTITAAASSITEETVTFSTAFSSTPQIFLSMYSTTTNAYYGYLTLMFANQSTTGFTIRVANAYTTSFTPSIRWMAVLL